MSDNRLVRFMLPVLGLALLILVWHVGVVAFDVPPVILRASCLIPPSPTGG